MPVETLFIVVIIITGFAALGMIIQRGLASPRPQKDQEVLLSWLKSMQASLENTNTGMTKILQENTRQLNDRLDTAARVIGDLKGSLGEMSEVGRGIKSLQEFLQSPKLRGNIGEQVLKDMIGQTFPKNSFHLQYAFRSGMKVDAALKTEAGLLCIDSKFPMENFTKMHNAETEKERLQARKDFVADVKKHISDISKKYILPEEGTLDFALMYIPSEAVYYEIANLTQVMNFAQAERVYPVSPNTLYAHLQVLLLSFQGKEMEAKSRQVFQLLRAMKKDYSNLSEVMDTLGKHINNSYHTMSNATGIFTQLGQKLHKSEKLDEKLLADEN